jgi:spermidine/putrescine-binding protein
VADRIIPALIKGNALRPLPEPHDFGFDFHYVGHGFVDKDNKYSLPYGLSLMTVGFRTTVKSQVQHWADLDNPSIAKTTFFFDPVPIKLLDEKGRTWATVKKNILPEQDPLAGPLPAVNLASANYAVGPYGAMKLALGTEAAGWKFVLPEDGSIIYLYHVVLPTSGQRPDLADTLFPLLFDPTVTSHLDSDNILATTQPAALALSPPDQAHDVVLYPPLPVLSHCVFSHR